MSPTDLKLLEGQINNLRTICNIYGLDSSLFNDPENKTFSNRKEAQIAAYTDTYIPLGKFINEKKARYLSKRFNTTVEIEINEKDIPILQTNDMDGESVMMSIEQGNYYGLDPTGGRIWALIAEPVSVAALLETLAGEFDVEVDVCATDTLRFLNELLEHSIIEVVDEAHP